MSDWLLEAGQNPLVSKAVKGLSLPVSFPEPLRRADGPCTEAPLAGMTVVVRAGKLSGLASMLVEAGARVESDSDEAHALVFDATGLEEPSELDDLHRWFGPRVKALARCGRVVVLHAPPADAASPSAAATRMAVDGFVRSLAKEIGRRGSTANRVEVDERTADRLAPVLRFLLGNRSSFVTGQPLLLSTTARRPAEAPLVRSLEGKVAIVTGAARGIGAATAMRLGAEGAHVVCLDREQESELVSRVAESCGGSALLVDMRSAEAPERIAGHLSTEFGGVDIVVHNAGITRDRTLARMSDEEWGAVLDINLRAILQTTDRLLDGVLGSWGRIIALSSAGGISGNPGQTNYAATKAGLRAWVSALAPVVGRRGITVNAIAPGFIETRMTGAMPPVPREFGRRLSALGQGGTPLDIAESITFMASPGASGLTGQTIRVCGGLFLGA